MSEPKEHLLCNGIEIEHGMIVYEPWKGGYYRKSEADKVIAELKDKCQMHDFFWEGCSFAKRGFKNTIAVSEAFDNLDAENRALKRALWLARANAYRYIAELISCFNPDFIRNRRMFTPNNLKQKQMNSLEWAKLMLKVERKCLAKAEEYK